jgi:hypothetical protein
MPTLPAHSDVERFVAAHTLFLVPFAGSEPLNSEPTAAQLAQVLPVTASSAGIVFGGALDLNGYALLLDADGDTYLDASADDVIDV